VFVFLTKIVEHGGCRGNAMCLMVAPSGPSSEALDVLHQAMRPASHHRIRMVIKIVIDLPAFFVALISLLATTIS
jgi:hypothetical protein